MVNRHPRIKDIISGIILLAARGKEPMPLAKVHSIIHAMKSHEPILSGLRFSLTGAVCYSRDIDQAINHLTDGGFLKIVEGSAFVGERALSSGTIYPDFSQIPRSRPSTPFRSVFTTGCEEMPGIRVTVHDTPS